MRPTTAIQLLTGIPHAITPNINPRLAGAHLPSLLPILTITETAMVAVVQAPVLVLLHPATITIHPIAIPIILKDHLLEKTPHSTQTLQSTPQSASIQRAVYSPKRARTHLSKDWRII
jgi:hypothetical protein